LLKKNATWQGSWLEREVEILKSQNKKIPKGKKITLLQGNKTYREHTSILNSKNF
jgi:hypothetical protein